MLHHNFIWQHLDVDKNDLAAIRQQYLNALDSNTEFFQPIDIGLKYFLGLSVHSTILINALPNSTGIVHSDYRADKNFLALNISLLNCENSVTEFWETTSESEVRYTPLNIPYNYYDKNKCNKLTEFTLSKPVLFNTKILHSVKNNSNMPRLAISLRFKEDPWHLVSVL